MAEVDHQDSWQRATLSAALTSGSLRELERQAARLERFVLDRHPEGAWVEAHLMSESDLVDLGVPEAGGTARQSRVVRWPPEVGPQSRKRHR